MSIAFKEWALVCDAIGRGQQSIILRKGGIAEGRAGFAFQHADFFLFPTLFHEQLASTKLPPETAMPEAAPDRIEIRYCIRVEWTALIDDLAVAQKLADFHIWRDEVIAERFGYGKWNGLNLAFIRAYRLAEPCVLENQPAFGGCRSWVELPDVFDVASEPALNLEAHHAREKSLKKILDPIPRPVG
ncbi:MAG: DUF1802 family protein [Verrucomicrobiota bacterium]|nr:DUF1802 family protein [Verrucomicrobiota bacterium]